MYPIISSLRFLLNCLPICRYCYHFKFYTYLLSHLHMNSNYEHLLAIYRSKRASCKYNKTCVKRPLSKRPKSVFKTNYRLMQVKSITECSKWSILQYFRPSLRYQLLLRSLFCLFLSGRFTHILLYIFLIVPYVAF